MQITLPTQWGTHRMKLLSSHTMLELRTCSCPVARFQRKERDIAIVFVNSEQLCLYAQDLPKVSPNAILASMRRAF